MDLMMFRQQQKPAQPSSPHRVDSLYASNGRELQQRLGGHETRVHESSPDTFLATRGSKPLALSVLVGGALLAAWALKDKAAKLS